MNITILVSGSVRSNFSYRMMALGRSLVKLGHTVSVIAPSADKYNKFIPEAIDKLDGVKVWQPFQFATKRLEINLLPYMIGATYRVLREKSDLVIIYKPTPVSVVGLFAKLFRGTPVILDMDDLGSEVMRVEGHPVHQRKLVEWCEGLTARYADRIVAATNNLKAHYQALYPKKPIHVMTNGVDTDWFGPMTPSKNFHHIVFMGAVNRQSILEPLFDALPKIVQKFPDAKATIIGDGTFLPYFKEKCTKLGIAKHVEFTGWLTLEGARIRLFEGDMGYNYMPDSPTTRAVNNMKVPQYMARGVVPVVSDIGDLAKIVETGKAGYISKPDDTEAFGEVLLKAFADSERMQKAVRARAVSEQQFNWDNLAAGFIAWANPQPGQKPGRKKNGIFVVSTAVPGNVGGPEIRIYNLVKQIIKRHPGKVEVFCISSKDPERDAKICQSELGVPCHVVGMRKKGILTSVSAVTIDQVPPFLNDFRTSALGDVFRAACEESMPAIVHIEQLHGYYAIRKHIPWLRSHGVKIVLDTHNIEFEALHASFRISSFLKRMAGMAIIHNFKKIEIEALRASDAVLACSERDADFFRQYNPATFVIPNGVNCAEFGAEPRTANGTLIFMGGVAYPPNADGLKFYIEDIHPRVKKVLPEAHLLAIGADKKWLNGISSSDASIAPLGFVDDVRPYMARASIGICPIRHGGGTRIKIMTYMAAGLPVVSTKKGAEGVGYRSGSDIIITDDSQEFADQIFRLSTDKDYYARIATGGQKFIRANFDWDVIGEKLAHIYEPHRHE